MLQARKEPFCMLQLKLLKTTTRTKLEFLQLTVRIKNILNIRVAIFYDLERSSETVKSGTKREQLRQLVSLFSNVILSLSKRRYKLLVDIFRSDLKSVPNVVREDNNKMEPRLVWLKRSSTRYGKFRRRAKKK